MLFVRLAVLIFGISPAMALADQVSIRGLDKKSSDIFITGVVHGILGVSAREWNDRGQAFFCPPDDVAISFDLVVDLVSQYEDGPVAGDSFSHTAVYALATEFPCP
ncbi:hypothetical protein M3484_17400 [Pseudomonas sp. GX19020]|uniref:hypothetical protein n=1 Tax=Pseudomonas sp. GX19020 TaxID=2942277 RepID=UPI002019C152|nr:hypothetical protein [Pseudomonas sp. GX19020]MCL4068345.1 hypothetical protein [Pseudomonas sp. GX19020]